MRSDVFNFEVPPHRIAQVPLPERADSRLMVVRRGSRRIEHAAFADLPGLLQPRDLLVLNNTRVKPCRLYAHRETGGRVEVFILRALGDDQYEALTASNRRLADNEVLTLDDGRFTLIERDHGGPGHWRVHVQAPGDTGEWLEQKGRMPLPQYIRREKGPDPHDALDRERYQTVFAHADGAVAAPTAGLHFTPEVLEACRARGISDTCVTLHVGPGTFRPLKADTLPEHDMHAEDYEVPSQAEAAVAETRRAGGRVVAVGTTACRTLETTSNDHGVPSAGRGSTRLFIYPPWRFRCVDVLLTNFHLPRSTLIFLVAAYLGTELTRQAYEEALAQDYRFFSYGDAMLCLPE
jgi:S-adenosylmethionine:tRNA ribosyltransferase-isomerase